MTAPDDKAAARVALVADVLAGVEHRVADTRDRETAAAVLAAVAAYDESLRLGITPQTWNLPSWPTDECDWCERVFDTTVNPWATICIQCAAEGPPPGVKIDEQGNRVPDPGAAQ
jgi:hypothetical protein